MRLVQELSTHAILTGRTVSCFAPTAGGKTGRSFLPLLPSGTPRTGGPLSVLYLAPIRALLNNQEERLQRLTGLIGRRAAKWHGDVGASARRRIIADLPDVLAITPESLEAMLLSPRPRSRYSWPYSSGRRR
ncbi:MAG: DEAD/DEAH box helicase [Deltaproteobacteria bacterium]|nr:DEAD/DEAH box helicase [Deltaproteobacteria bacterium]